LTDEVGHNILLLLRMVSVGRWMMCMVVICVFA